VLYIFVSPGSGSGSIRQRHGSGSRSFYHQAKIVRKTLIVLFLTSFGLFIFDLNVPSNGKKQKKFFLVSFFVGVFKVNDENSRIQIRIRIHWSEAWIRGSSFGSGSTPKSHGFGTLPVSSQSKRGARVTS